MRRPLIPAPWSHVLVLLALACLGAYAVASWAVTQACVFCGRDLDIDTIEANTSVDIPQSATQIESYAEGLREIDTYVRFVIPPRDLPALLASTGATANPYQFICLPEAATRSHRHGGIPRVRPPLSAAAVLKTEHIKRSTLTHQTPS